MEDTKDVLDFTEEVEERDLGVRLKNGLDLKDLKAGESFIFEPNIEKEFIEREQEERTETYYSKFSSNIDNLRQSANTDFDITEDWSVLKERMVPLTADSGVLKWTKRKGKNDRKLPEKACVTCYYEMSIEGQDEPFDSSIIRGRPERFKLDCRQMILGIEYLLKSMRVGEISIGILAPGYAFGMQGVPPRIPGNAEIMVEIQLISFTEEGEAQRILALHHDDRNNLPLEEVFSAAEKEHRSGNVYFKNGELKLALQSYGFAFKILELRSKEEKSGEKVRDLFIRLHLNKAVCFLNLEMGSKAADQCTKVLALDPDNAKAHYRRGKAFVMIKQYKLAKENLLRASKLQPKDKDIEKELGRLNKIIKEMKQQELDYSRRMFSDVEQLPEKQDQGILSSPVYIELKKFKDDPEAKEITLPSVFLLKEKQVLKRAANYLNLNLRIRDVAGLGEQKVVITKKSK